MSKKTPRNQLSQNDGSNLVAISDLAESAEKNQLKTEVVRLEKLNVGLSQTVDNLLSTIENKDNEIKHLKDMLMGNTPIIGEASNLLMSDEKLIAEKQLARLLQFSMLRELTLDEAKRVEIFTKIKNAQEKEAKNDEGSALPKDVTPIELLALASGTVKKDKK